MNRNGNRTVKITKAQLIDKIKENKKNHIAAYDKAVIAYKKAALKQLVELTNQLTTLNTTIVLLRYLNGKLEMKLNYLNKNSMNTYKTRQKLQDKRCSQTLCI